jgi:Protein of unknown function (DUF2569)
MTIGDSLGPEGRRPELYGVRGWLLFLCITLMVFLPIQIAAMLFVIFRSTTAASLQVLVLGLPVVIAANALGVVAGILLYREKPLGVRLAKIWCGLTILLSVLVVIGDPQAVVNSPITVLRTAGLQTAWLVYLYRSERVRNTYSRVRAENAAEVFR